MEQIKSDSSGKLLSIVWLCNFNNEEIASNFINNPGNNFAPWITSFIKGFEKHGKQLDLHIIAPNLWDSRLVTFSKNRIKYYFFPTRIPLINKSYSNLKDIDYRSDFLMNKMWVKYIVKKIKPNLIHLWGAENAYYSSTVIQFRKTIPIFLTIQGIVDDQSDKFDFKLRKRISVQNQLLKTLPYFGTRDHNMEAIIRNHNPHAEFLRHDIIPFFPNPELLHANIAKEYDLIFFARITKQKGIEDLIFALEIVKKQLPNVTLAIAGPHNEDYLDQLKNLCQKLQLEKNIHFLGSFISIDEIHTLAIKSSMTILPTHNDTIPGTIVESMLLKIPCISYAVGGIAGLNENVEVIKLVNKGNIDELANTIIDLLINPEEQKKISENAFKYAKGRWSPKSIVESIEEIYCYITKKNSDV